MKRLFFRLVLTVLFAAAALAGIGWWYSGQPLGVARGATEFTVSRGAGMRQAADAIARAGVGVYPPLLTWLARLTGRARQVKAGCYEVRAGITPWQLIHKLEAGEVSQASVLLLEGWTFRQVRAALEKHPDLLPDTTNLADDQLLARIGAGEKHLEGLFFPDTYTFDKKSSALAVFVRAYRAMATRLGDEWRTRDANLPLKAPYEALVLASIVEKETGRGEDRTRIANVFINRLRVGWPLQTDPTVIYGMGEKFDGNLRRQDLQTDTPWNTYTRKGLPPTPIAMPGRESLRATLHPEGGDMMYFVACGGNGGSEFSRTLAEHNRAVDRCQRNRGAAKK
ncbi:MAG: endolytic transglycosylase MltG [Azoarcus sp.]|jgi:UPF0755 protein|nr:endolytic transglycosylase MltG [Azoarcus sp.]